MSSGYGGYPGGSGMGGGFRQGFGMPQQYGSYPGGSGMAGGFRQGYGQPFETAFSPRPMGNPVQYDQMALMGNTPRPQTGGGDPFVATNPVFNGNNGNMATGGLEPMGMANKVPPIAPGLPPPPEMVPGTTGVKGSATTNGLMPGYNPYLYGNY